MVGAVIICIDTLLLADSNVDAQAPVQGEPEPLMRLAEPGGQFFGPGDLRRPRAETPPMTSPTSESTGPSETSAPRSGTRGDDAEGSRDLGEHRPGELYLVPGEHRPGDLDRQGTFRPGDLG